MADTRLFTFVAGDAGPWRVVQSVAVKGAGLSAARSLAVVAGQAVLVGAAWKLSGITSNERYVTRAEKSQLVARQQGLGRAGSDQAALIPIRKSAAWWAMTQDERRAVFEEQSQHTAIGLRYLPAVARRLHHCRDLGGDEPFDFLTWFEFASADAALFDQLVSQLRATPEWSFVEREVEIRLVRKS